MIIKRWDLVGLYVIHGDRSLDHKNMNMDHIESTKESNKFEPTDFGID